MRLSRQFWSSTQSCATILSQFVIMLLLSRILTPADFAFYAINVSIIQIAIIFSEMGIGQYLIKENNICQTKLGEFLGATIITSVSILIFLDIICLLIAKNIPSLNINVSYFWTLSLSILLFSVKSISFSFLQRQGRHVNTACAELSAQCCNVCVSFFIALTYQSYWALALGYLSYYFVSTFICIIKVPVLPRLQFQRIIEIKKFAANFIFLKTLDLITRSLDNLILASTMSSYDVGIYHRATNMRNLGHTFSFQPNQQVYYPQISRAVNENDAIRLQITYENFISASLNYSIPVSIAAFIMAPSWITIIFGDQWVSAGVLIQILSLSIPFRSMESGLTLLAQAKGQQYKIIPYKIMFALFYIISIFLASLIGLKEVAIVTSILLTFSSIYSFKWVKVFIGLKLLQLSKLIVFKLLAFKVCLLLAIALFNAINPLVHQAVASIFASILVCLAFLAISHCYEIYKIRYF
jgi:O-antigen/teichoic acid export membrane protein